MLRILLLICALVPFMQGNCQYTWSTPPLTASTTGVNSSDPHLKVDASGNATAVFVQNGFVVVNTLPNGGTWGTYTTLSGSGASSPRLVLDSSGNATAIWLESTGILTTATSTSWATTTALSLAGSSSPVITIDSSNNIVAVWVNGGVIQSKTLLNGGSWPGSIDTLSTTAGAALPDVAASDGVVTAVWHVLGSTKKVYSAQKTISGGVWASEIVISNTGSFAGYPHVAIDPYGDSMAIWYQWNEIQTIKSNVVLTSAYRPNGASWGSPISISTPGLYDPIGLFSKVAFNQLALAFVFWSESLDGSTFNMAGALQNAVAGGWQGPQDVLPGTQYGLSGDLGVVSMGDIIAVFMGYDGSNVNIQASDANILTFEQTIWSTPVVISTPGPNSHNDSLSLSAATNAANTINYVGAVWVYYNGSNTVVQSATALNNLIAPATSLSVTPSSNNFNVFTELYNTLQWTASTSPSVTSYYVFRNSVEIGQPTAVPGTNTFIDHNRVSGDICQYTVVATDGNGNISPFVQVVH